MKLISLIFASALLASTSSFARSEERFVCRQISPRALTQKTMILTQIGKSPLREGRRISFLLQIFSAGDRQSIFNSVVFVELEDVVMTFKSPKDRLSGVIYLDELDQTSVTLNGKRANFDCNPPEQR